MNIYLNGIKQTVNEAATLEQVINADNKKSMFAVAVNSQFVPKSDYAKTQLQDDDKIELLIPMQGG